MVSCDVMFHLPVFSRKKIFILACKLSLTFITITTGLFTFVPVSVSTAAPASQSALQNQLKQIQDQISQIKAQKDKINNQIADELKNQDKLKNDTLYINDVIQKNELQAQDLQLQLQQLNLQISIINEDKKNIENKLNQVQQDLDKLNAEMLDSGNLLYKMTLTEPSFLEKSTSFEDTVINQEKTKVLVSTLKANFEKVKTLQEEVKTKKAQIEAKKKELDDLQTEKLAQNDNLKMQQDGLASQKENKQKLIEQSKQSQAQLASTQEDLSKKINEYEQKLTQLRTSLYTLAPSGTRVSAGQIIGFQGRSGLNCDLIQPGVVRTNTYCQTLAGLSSEWYYYDPVAYPTKGNHLHFEYRVNNVPQTQAWLNGTGQKPLDKFTVTQGFHQGGAFDISNYFQAPVYAIKPGKIQYYCDSFPNDPAYGAIIYHDDGTKSQYWHMQRKPGSPPCKPL